MTKQKVQRFDKLVAIYEHIFENKPFEQERTYERRMIMQAFMYIFQQMGGGTDYNFELTVRGVYSRDLAFDLSKLGLVYDEKKKSTTEARK